MSKAAAILKHDIIDRISKGVGMDKKQWPMFGSRDEVDRSKFLSASEAAGCLRRAGFDKAGFPPEAQRWGAMRRGDGVEAFIVDKIARSLSADENLVLFGEQQRTIVDYHRRLIATPDGVLLKWKMVKGEPVYIKEGLYVEVKSVDPRSDWSKFPKDQHVWQARIGSQLVNEQTNYRVDKIALVYVDASFWDEMEVFYIDIDGRVADASGERSKQLFGVVDKLYDGTTARHDIDAIRQLPAEGVMVGDCKYCPFITACGASTQGKAQGAPKGQRVKTRAKGINALAEEYYDIDQEEKALKDRKAVLKDDIIVEMANARSNKLTLNNGLELDLTNVAGRETLDKEAMKRAGIDLSQYTKVGKPSTRLVVKRV